VQGFPGRIRYQVHMKKILGLGQCGSAVGELWVKCGKTGLKSGLWDKLPFKQSYPMNLST
jgi:hypothetical protein